MEPLLLFVIITIVITECLHALRGPWVKVREADAKEDWNSGFPLPPLNYPDDAARIDAPEEPDVRTIFNDRVAGEPQPDGTRIGRGFIWQGGEIVMNISKNHKGKGIFDMTRDQRDCGFFHWMLKQNFTEQEKKIAKSCLENRWLIEEADPWKGD